MSSPTANENSRIIQFHPSVAPVQVALDGVYVDYPGHPDALRDVSLTIRRGERVSIIGPSGSGKSTLLKTVNGLLPVARGTRKVELSSRSDTAREEDHTHPNVAMVFQEFALAQRLPVLTNVLIGSLGTTSRWKSLLGMFPHDVKEQARQLISAVGLKGYEQTRVDQLSSGQKQRVAIARALMQEQELLLADEPVASLDIRTADAILNLLSGLQEEWGFTLVLSLHEIEQARRISSRVIGINRGRVVFDGPTASLDHHTLESIFGGADVVEYFHA